MMYSVLPIYPKNTPACILVTVSLASIVSGLVISISGSFAVPFQRALAPSLIPGEVTPELKLPPASTRSYVVAVPKSITMTGPPYISYAATASTSLSEPRALGLGIAILIPVFMPGATIIGLT